MLFEPIIINGMQLKNRVVRSATYEAMATEDGKITDKIIKFYTRLAKGGVGLIITGHAYIQKNGIADSFQLGAYSDEHVMGLKKLTTAIHEQNTMVALQISHAGRQTVPEAIGGQTPMGPSSIEADSVFNVSPREMTVEEILKSIDAFVKAAERSKKAGFDAVQLHAAHGYLMAQFLSSHTNRRSDEWGGTPEKRMRFIIETYKKVRQAVGKIYPVLIKLSVDEGIENGITLSEAINISQTLSQLGIDAIEISGGTIADTVFMVCRGDIPIDILTSEEDLSEAEKLSEQLYSIKDNVMFKEAYWLQHAEKIKAVIKDTPLILVGGMKYPQTMERVLESKKADLISLSRALIREPNLPNEMEKGRKNPVKCSFCNRCLFETGSGSLRCYNLG
ncbi:MAG: NADH:flavin oxidoreductase [Desulfobacterales bacterium]|nr:NADH:flavin oxidoreductase [Desulfobacterales bacterium]